MERKLEAVASGFLKKWAGLARCATTAILYLPRASGVVGLPALSTTPVRGKYIAHSI